MAQLESAHQGSVGGGHDHVEALGAIINGASESGGSGINQVQQREVDGLSGLMSEGSSLRPSGAVSAPPAPNVEMRQISPLIDQWFNSFGDLSNGLSVTLKKALVEKPQTRNEIWKHKDFYTKMITKIDELKMTSQQFDDSLALGLLFHMIVYAHTINFSALKIDDLKFQDQRPQSPVSFGFFPSSGNNSCILSTVRYDSCVFIGHPDWSKVEKGSIVDINGGGHNINAKW